MEDITTLARSGQSQQQGTLKQRFFAEQSLSRITFWPRISLYFKINQIKQQGATDPAEAEHEDASPGRRCCPCGKGTLATLSFTGR